MFRDRKDAGEKLGEALEVYKKCEGMILAIPKGGVEVGFYAAKHLQLPFSMIVVRKLPLPENPEAGFGAIAEDGSIFLAGRFHNMMPSYVVERIIKEQKKELRRRIKTLRSGKPLPEIRGKTVILIDDGIAMGSTMQAAIMLCKKRKAEKIVVASPVAGPEMAAKLARMVDDVVILEKPVFFQAVAEAYRNWYDVSDEEVIRIMQELDDYQGCSQEGD